MSHAVDNPVFIGDADGSPKIRNRTKQYTLDDDKEDQQREEYEDMDDEEEEDEDYETNCCSRLMLNIQSAVVSCFDHNKKILKYGIILVLVVLYFAYFGYSMYYEFGDDGSLRLLVCTCIGVFLAIVNCLPEACWSPFTKCAYLMKARPILGRVARWVFYVLALAAIVLSLIFTVGKENPENLLSLAGLAAFIFLTFITSANPARVNWHPVFWGLCVQYFFALLILRVDWGYQAFKYLGDRVTEFLDHAQEGAKFVFGDSYEDHKFAFSILPVIVFFSTSISVLYHLGVMQAVIKVLGRALAFCLDTTPAESLNAAGNIFIGMTEAPLMIRPFLPVMTRSEIHAVMTGGFATIAGTVLAAYISFGVPAQHLLSACVMSAPAALAISKLSCPETQKSKSTSDDYNKLEGGDARNVIEALSNGASMSIKLVSNVAVNIMAFLSALHFVNATLGWLGARAGVPDLSFQFICSYVLYPVAIFMGVEPKDCRAVAELVGIKTFANEFIAYSQLSTYIDNRKVFDNYTQTYNETNWVHHKDDIILLDWNNRTLTGGILTPRSEVISTYALCGFSNVGSMGIMLGGLGALAPSRKRTMTSLVLRAMIAGNIACFMTGCIAGLMYKEF